MYEVHSEAYNQLHAFPIESVLLALPLDRDLFGGCARHSEGDGIDDSCRDFPRVPCDFFRPGRRRAVVVLGVQ